MAIVIEEFTLVLPRHWLVGIDGRACLDLLLVQSDVDHTLFPVDALHGNRRDQHLAPAEPVSRVDYQIADSPAMVVEVDVLDSADLPVRGRNRPAEQLIQAI